MKQHTWVTMSWSPIMVEPQPDGSLSVFVADDQAEAATEQSLEGCWFCHTPLTPESFYTECEAEIAPVN